MCTRSPNHGMYTASSFGPAFGACKFCRGVRWAPGVVHPVPTMKHTIATASSFLDKITLRSQCLNRFRCRGLGGRLASEATVKTAELPGFAVQPSDRRQGS